VLAAVETLADVESAGKSATAETLIDQLGRRRGVPGPTEREAPSKQGEVIARLRVDEGQPAMRWSAHRLAAAKVERRLILE